MSVRIEKRKFEEYELETVVNSGDRVIETPHMGVDLTYDRSQVGTICGGLANELVVVDTVRANTDRFGAVRSWNGQGLYGKKAGRDRLAADTRAVHFAGVCEEQIGKNAWTLLQSCGNEGRSTYDMIKFRMLVLDLVSSDGSAVTSFSDYWNEAGETSAAMQSVIASRSGFSRFYESGRAQVELLKRAGMYYEGSACEGILTTTESLFAIFAVEAALAGDSVLFHLCSASRDYADVGFMKRAKDLSEETLAELGKSGSNGSLILVDRDYVERSETNIFELVESVQL